MNRSIATIVVLTVSLLSSATAEEAETPWSSGFHPPDEIISDLVKLEPLKPAHTELDFQAVMGNRAYLRRVLQWGGWPTDEMSLEDNRNALQNHWNEFENKEAYAYTVLSPDGNLCLGCVYIEPVDNDPNTLSVFFWIVEDQVKNALDQHLAELLIQNVEDCWPANRIEFSVPSQNSKGIETFKKIGLNVSSKTESQTIFIWTRTQ